MWGRVLQTVGDDMCAAKARLFGVCKTMQETLLLLMLLLLLQHQ
jgi:hypothetical protein